MVLEKGFTGGCGGRAWRVRVVAFGPREGERMSSWSSAREARGERHDGAAAGGSGRGTGYVDRGTRIRAYQAWTSNGGREQNIPAEEVRAVGDVTLKKLSFALSSLHGCPRFPRHADRRRRGQTRGVAVVGLGV